jgi:hypothetical protein
MVVAVVVVGWSFCSGWVGVLAMVMVGWCSCGGVPAVVMFGWGSYGGDVWVGFLRWFLSPPSMLLSLLCNCFFFFDSFKSNYCVWVSSFWIVKNSDVVCS